MVPRADFSQPKIPKSVLILTRSPRFSLLAQVSTSQKEIYESSKVIHKPKRVEKGSVTDCSQMPERIGHEGARVKHGWSRNLGNTILLSSGKDKEAGNWIQWGSLPIKK